MSFGDRRPRGRPKNPTPPPPPPREGRGDAEYAALKFAMDEKKPGCLADIAFTTDHPGGRTQAELRHLRDVCAACPVFSEYATYARVGRPAAGFWAGSDRGRPT